MQTYEEEGYIMANHQSLHPSVKQFKQFVKLHPLLINEVKEGRKTWQDVYEEWVILGENHESWEDYKIAKNNNKETVAVKEKSTNEKKQSSEKNNEKSEESQGQSSEVLTHLVGLIKNMNFDDIQRHMSQLNGILSNVQQLMSVFQGGQKQNQQPQQPPEQPHDPFSFRGF